MDRDYMPAGNRSFSYRQEPPAQRRAKQIEVTETLKELPLLTEVLEHLDAQIAYLSSIDSVEADLSKSPAAHQKQVAANKLAKQFLENERTYILARVEQAK